MLDSNELPWTGERLVTSIKEGDIVLEHLHRYAFAAELVAGKDVLDIASGEGYGSNLLASVARSVIGVDISEETTRHAERKYVRPNLTFREGSCLSIPIPNQTLDAVVSFETLEHMVEQEQFLAEVRRVLRPGGILVSSTPDKSVYTGQLGNQNHFHLRELEAGEFHLLLRGSFTHVRMLSQRVGLGSFLAPTTTKDSLIEVGTHRGNYETISFTSGVAEAVYLIGVASDLPLPPLKVGLFEFGQKKLESDTFITPLMSQRASRDDEMAKLAAAHGRQTELEDQLRIRQSENQRLNKELSDQQNENRRLNDELEVRQDENRRLNEELRVQQNENRRFDEELRVKQDENRRLNGELSVQQSETWRVNEELRVQQNESRRLIEENWHLTEVLRSAEQWQKFWFRRIFQRWHPPGAGKEKTGFLKKLERSIRKRRKWLFSRLSGGRVKVPVDSPVNEPGDLGPGEWPLNDGKKRVVYVSGEPDTPGHSYRVQMYADTLARQGCSVQILRLDQIRQDLALIEAADVAVVWRSKWSDELAEAVAALKKNGGKMVFDVDDYMFDPVLARIEVIDGIRSQGFTETMLADHFRLIQQTMLAADYCICPTNPLATAMRRFQKAAFVLPNGYDEETYVISRRAAAKWRNEKNDDLVRLGYAGGSRTHQRDFSKAAPAVARILREHPECRLVLFRAEFPNASVPLLDVEEFQDLAGLESQIEWRPLVPLRELPGEIARFDINLAPLEAGNLFCECKSELKYFEAALAGVPTVASPTRPYAAAIRHNESGCLAANLEEWYDCLKRLVIEPTLRQRIANEALFDVLWRNGPERRAELVDNVMEQISLGGRIAAKSFELELHRAKMPRRSAPQTSEHDLILEFGERAHTDVDVVIPLYNYSQYVEEALESVKAQTMKKIGLIVVDDCSTDDSLAVVQGWMERNQASFIHVALLKNRRNSGLAHTRNTGFAFSDALFVMPLDADNVLHPQCLECCFKAITGSQAAVAFPTIKEFGDTQGNRSCNEWCPSRFVSGNYIDAMALIHRTAWAAAGGYDRIEVAGWEDYDLWCKFVHRGFWGVWLPEVLAAYRVHDQSMLNTTTDLSQKKRLLISEMQRRHEWLDILPP